MLSKRKIEELSVKISLRSSKANDPLMNKLEYKDIKKTLQA